jgi:uncharacterized protein YdcH (DUF465 family)
MAALLKEYEMGDMGETTRAHLLKVMEHLPEVEAWRAKQKDPDDLNHPSRVWTAYDRWAKRQEKSDTDSDEPKPLSKLKQTEQELARALEEVNQLKAHIDDLEGAGKPRRDPDEVRTLQSKIIGLESEIEDLKSAANRNASQDGVAAPKPAAPASPDVLAAKERAAHKTKPANEQPKPDGKDAEITQLREELAITKLMLVKAERKLAAAKAKPPPLPPDARRDAHIAKLKTQIENLKKKLHQVEGYNLKMTEAGGMSFRTMSLIAKVLHPDTRKQVTEADLDEACKAFTAWKGIKAWAERRNHEQAESPAFAQKHYDEHQGGGC